MKPIILDMKDLSDSVEVYKSKPNPFITIDKNTGKAYYIVEVKLQKRKLKDKSGKELKLRNGMACTAKLIKGEKTVLKFIVEKLF